MAASDLILSLEQARHVAKLARLSLSDTQLQLFRGQLHSILGYVEKLAELDLTDVEPMAYPTEMSNRLDDDRETTSIPLDALLSNAPDSVDRYLAVPKVLAEGDG